ncbi:MAG: hypothetical protein ACJ8LN_10990 [Sulfurifustis sp.]
MEDQLFRLITQALKDVNETRETPIDLSRGKALVLYGTIGVFDSMGLVNFLSAVEEAIEDTLQRTVSLTSEKAVSRRVSPFSSVAALIGFIVEELGVTESEVA